MRNYAAQLQARSISTRPNQPQRSRATLWVSLGALAVITPLVLVSLTIILFQVFQLNLPGVIVFDKDVGLMGYEETVTWIDSYWNHSRLLQLSHPDDPDFAYIVSPKDLGYWVDAEATAGAAYDIGRDADPLDEIMTAISGEKQIVLPVMYYDESLARQTLESIAGDLSISPEDATVAYQDGAWLAVPGMEGQTIDIDATLDELFKNAFTIYLTQTVTLQMQTIPPAISDLSPVLDEIEAVVSQDLNFTAYDPITDESFTWSVPADVKRDWVTVDPATFAVGLSYDENAVAALLNTWESELGESRFLEMLGDLDEMMDDWENGQPMFAFIRHAPTTYRVSAGESLWSISLELGIPMWYIMDANEGLTTSNLEAGMNLTIPSKNDLLPLPVVPNKRIVIDISEQRMTVYEDGQVRSTHIVSTGVSDSPTMVGIFQVQTHEINAYASNWDLYMPHFMGIYEAWPGFMNGIHGLPLLSSGQRLWASTLGSPVSYGCIILDLAAAEDLYYWAEPGVVVEIKK